jgi:hypothetical protein
MEAAPKRFHHGLEHPPPCFAGPHNECRFDSHPIRATSVRRRSTCSFSANTLMRKRPLPDAGRRSRRQLGDAKVLSSFTVWARLDGNKPRGTTTRPRVGARERAVAHHGAWTAQAASDQGRMAYDVAFRRRSDTPERRFISRRTFPGWLPSGWRIVRLARSIHAPRQAQGKLLQPIEHRRADPHGSPPAVGKRRIKVGIASLRLRGLCVATGKARSGPNRGLPAKRGSSESVRDAQPREPDDRE